MKNLKGVLSILMIVVMSLSTVACEKTTTISNGKIYYVRADKAGIIPFKYNFESTDTDGAISEALKQLASDVDDIDAINTIPSGVDVKNWELNNKSLDLYLVGDYESLDTYTEILVRAAIVKTLVQIKGVNSVSIFVNDSPLTDSTGEAIGAMSADTFIEDFGQETDSLLHTDLKLYFASADGVSTVPETRKVYYSRNVSLEKLVIDQLLKGPDTDGLLSAIPTGTKLNSITVSENGVCIVNFDGAIETVVSGVTENVTVYSIVNSLTELDNVKQVQILVNGETPHISNVDIDMSKAISRNEDIINEQNLNFEDEQEYLDEDYSEGYTEDEKVPAE